MAGPYTNVGVVHDDDLPAKELGAVTAERPRGNLKVVSLDADSGGGSGVDTTTTGGVAIF